MRRALPLLCIIAVFAAERLGAQQLDSVARHTSHVASRSRATWDVGRATVHWGKWLASAAALAFTAMGAHEHDNSNRVFSQLLDMCRADSAACRLASDGRYVNPAAEQLYQASIAYDHRAQVRLLAGQGSLLAAAGLFIADLRHHTGGPGNIPLKVAVDPQTGGALVGVRWSF
jgi:hypothetical protein